MDAPEVRAVPQGSAALPQDLVFVDLETTGGNAAVHRIIEVGIVRISGGALVEEWSSLVNPECLIPSYIESFTGITNAMVAAAPRFAEIAAQVLEKLQTATVSVSVPGPAEAPAPAPAPAEAQAAAEAQAPALAPAEGEGPASTSVSVSALGSGAAEAPDDSRRAPQARPAAPLFVAHNARFDYAFLRAEFRRAALPFSAKVLCTVKLSRRLFPQHARHNLDAVMARNELACSARHRALGDARVIGDFWLKLRRDLPPQSLALAVQSLLGADLPAHLPEGLADDLPEGPGVYRFYGVDDVPLYVGKSDSLRAGVLEHFGRAGREQRLGPAVRRVDWEETTGELGASLRELECIKTLEPRHNRRPKPVADGVTLRVDGNSGGIEIVSLAELEPGELAACFGVFHSRKDARKALVDIARARLLCTKVLGLDAGDGSCLPYQVGQCKGACIGQEPLILHAVRVQMALASLKLKAWPFRGRVALRERGALGGADFHVLDHWTYLGTARSEEELAALAEPRAPAAFDAQVYRILVRYFAAHPKLDWHDLEVPGMRLATPSLSPTSS